MSARLLPRRDRLGSGDKPSNYAVHVVSELLACCSNLRPPLARVGGPKPVLGPLLRTVAGGSLFRRS
jgi:hypothetical protein